MNVQISLQRSFITSRLSFKGSRVCFILHIVSSYQYRHSTHLSATVWPIEVPTCFNFLVSSSSTLSSVISRSSLFISSSVEVLKVGMSSIVRRSLSTLSTATLLSTLADDLALLVLLLLKFRDDLDIS